LKSSKSKVFKSNQSGLQLRNLNYLMTEQKERDDYMDEQDYESPYIRSQFPSVCSLHKFINTHLQTKHKQCPQVQLNSNEECGEQSEHRNVKKVHTALK